MSHYRRRSAENFYRGSRQNFDVDGNCLCQGCFERDRKIEQLRKQIVSLQAQVRFAQKDKVTRKDVLSAHTPSSQRRFKTNSSLENRAKQGGAAIGHLGHGRQSLRKDQLGFLHEVPMPKACPDCHKNLSLRDIRLRTIVECAPLKAKRVVYRCPRGACPKCGKVYSSRPPALPKCLYGNRLVAQAAVMHYVYGFSLGKISALLGEEVNEGALHGIFHRLARWLTPLREPLIEAYRQAPVKHADETGWRTDGHSGYAWLFSTPTLSLFEFRESRASRVAFEILGKKYLPGVLVVDRYNGYHKMPCQLQYCYAHLQRDVEKLGEEFAQDQEVERFVSTLALTRQKNGVLLSSHSIQLFLNLQESLFSGVILVNSQSRSLAQV